MNTVDTPDMYPQGATKVASTKSQQDRLERVEVLAKQAASLLVRTRLNLNITCQAYVSLYGASAVLTVLTEYMQRTRGI